VNFELQPNYSQLRKETDDDNHVKKQNLLSGIWFVKFGSECKTFFMFSCREKEV
jgi:hypothetical protein